MNDSISILPTSCKVNPAKGRGSYFSKDLGYALVALRRGHIWVSGYGAGGWSAVGNHGTFHHDQTLRGMGDGKTIATVTFDENGDPNVTALSGAWDIAQKSHKHWVLK